MKNDIVKNITIGIGTLIGFAILTGVWMTYISVNRQPLIDKQQDDKISLIKKDVDSAVKYSEDAIKNSENNTVKLNEIFTWQEKVATKKDIEIFYNNIKKIINREVNSDFVRISDTTYKKLN